MSVLSRLVVAALLSLSGISIFSYLKGAEVALEQQIDRAGPGRVYVSHAIKGGDSLAHLPSPLVERFGDAIEGRGAREAISIDFAFFKGVGEMNTPFTVGFYDPEFIGNIRFLTSIQSESSNYSEIFVFSSKLPVGLSIDVNILGENFRGEVMAMPGLLRNIDNNIFLFPKGRLGDILQSGRKSVFAFDMGLQTESVRGAVRAVESLIRAEQDYYRSTGQAPPEVIASIDLIDELEQTRELQALWGSVLILLIGAVTACVFGATATLEFHQSAFVCALIRSFGVRPRWLYFQRFLEAVFISASAYLISLGIALCTKGFLLQSKELGFADMLTIPLMVTTSIPLLFSLVAGAFFASLPVAFALKKEIGLILS